MRDQTNPEQSWVDAACWPLAFAQVREDPRIDLAALECFSGDELSVCMIASGGCTAAMLASSPRVRRLHLVDANPAQIVLARLKLRLLQSSDSPDRLAMLGHAPMPADLRAAQLADSLSRLELPADALGPAEAVAAIGPDFAGRYEALFARLVSRLAPHGTDFTAVLRLHEPAERIRRVAPGSVLGRTLDAALDETMALPILVRLFGREATQNSLQPFSRHFAMRVRHAIATTSTGDNPFLWQMLTGVFPQGVAYDWFHAEPASPMAEVTWAATSMDAAIASRQNEFDLVHLSNILDWLSPDRAAATLELARRSLRPGGLVLIRQLNSTLDIPALGTGLQWMPAFTDGLQDRDRSFFYRSLHAGRRI